MNPSHSVLYHDGGKVKKRKVEKSVCFLMKKQLYFSDSEDQDSSSVRSSRRRPARKFLSTVGGTYHLLNAVARINTKTDEFPVVGFHGYMAKGIPFIRVQNVQFQSAALHMWGHWRLLQSTKSKTLLCLYKTLVPCPESRALRSSPHLEILASKTPWMISSSFQCSSTVYSAMVEPCLKKVIWYLQITTNVRLRIW